MLPSPGDTATSPGESVPPYSQSPRFCGKTHATKGRFRCSIGSNISGPMPDRIAAAVVFNICMSWAEKFIARWDTVRTSTEEGPKPGGLPFVVVTTIVCCVNKKSAIDYHCRRSQVLEGTRIFSHFADAYPCGLRISTADRLADSDAAPLPVGNCPVGMLLIAWPNPERHIRFAAYPARPAGGT